MKKRLTKSLLVTAVLTALSACGGGGGGNSSGATQSGDSSTSAPLQHNFELDPFLRLNAADPRSYDGGQSYLFDYRPGFNGSTASAPLNKGNATLAKVELGQVNLKQPDSDYFALVAHRETLLRISVIGDQVNLRAPTLSVSLSRDDNNTVLYNTTLSAVEAYRVLPTVVDITDAGQDAPGKYKTVKTGQNIPDLNRSYLLKIPGDVLPGVPLTLTVQLNDPDFGDTDPRDNQIVTHFEPKAIDPLKIVMVPISVSGTTGRLPDNDLYTRTVMSKLPLSGLILRRREVWSPSDPNILNGKTPEQYGESGYYPGGIISCSRRSDPTCGGFEDLPEQDNSPPNEFYVGFLYGNDSGAMSSTANRVSTVPDDTANHWSNAFHSWPHELGHRPGSLPHTGQCGAGDDDEFYPYHPHGALNEIWPLDLFRSDNKIAVYDPSKFTSLMSYCNHSNFLSDYEVKRFLRDYKVETDFTSGWHARRWTQVPKQGW